MSSIHASSNSEPDCIYKISGCWNSFSSTSQLLSTVANKIFYTNFFQDYNTCKRFQRDRVFNIENSISELMSTAVHDRVTRQLRQGKFISYQKSAPVQTCFKSKVHGREIETAVSITYEVLASQKRQSNRTTKTAVYV